MGSMKGITALAHRSREPGHPLRGHLVSGLFKSVDAGVTWRRTSLVGQMVRQRT